MMKRVSIAAALLVLGASGTMAAECVNPSPTYSPAETKISVLFDSFRAMLNDNATCAVDVDAHQGANDPDLFEVYSVDVRGFAGPEDDDRAEITVDANGRSHMSQFDPNSPNEILSYYQGKEADGTLSSNTTVRIVNASPIDPDATLADVDSFDYTLAGTMTRADAEESLAAVGQGQTAMVTHLDATSGLLTGGNLALEGDDEVRVLGGVGSFMFGGNVRYNLAEGFSLLAGVSVIDQTAGGASYRGVMGAAALRFVQPGADTTRFFGEAGFNGGAMNTSFQRTYTATLTDSGVDDPFDTDTDVPPGTPTSFSASGSGDAAIGAIYVRGGALFSLDDANELVLSASLKQTVVGFGTYQEDVSSSNLFAADLSGQIIGFTTAKIAADWTAALATDLDVTAHLGVGTTMANQATSAYILGGGNATGEVASTVFAEYGLGAAYHLTPSSAIEGFVQGSTGTNIGTHAQIGAAYRMQF